MAVSTAAAFWAVSFLFVITPGADWAYAITAGLRHRTVVPAVSGLLAGHLVATLVVAAGVAVVVARSPVVLTALTVAGATYLVWLGVGMLTGPPAATEPPAVASHGSRARQAAKGLGVSGLNPKVFLLFLALLPQFVDPDAAWPLAVQIIALGLVHIASCAVVYTIVGTGARTVLRTRPTAARVVTKLSGGAMIVIGVVLIVEQFIVQQSHGSIASLAVVQISKPRDDIGAEIQLPGHGSLPMRHSVGAGDIGVRRADWGPSHSTPRQFVSKA